MSDATFGAILVGCGFCCRSSMVEHFASFCSWAYRATVDWGAPAGRGLLGDCGRRSEWWGKVGCSELQNSEAVGWILG